MEREAKMISENKTRAIVYRRASTDEDTQVHSLNRQELQIQQFVENHGYVVVETFAEYGSAYQSNDRPQFKAALEKLAADQSLVLLVNDLTRLSRSLEGYGDWKNYLDRIRFASLGNKTVEPLVAELLLVVSANESRVLGSRIKSGIQAKRQRDGDKFVWGFGVHKDQSLSQAQSKSLQTRQKRARETARRIVSMVRYLEAQGIESRKAQCEELEARGVTTSRGNKVTPVAINKAFRMIGDAR